MGTLLAQCNNPAALAARHYAEAALFSPTIRKPGSPLGVVGSRSVDEAIGYFRKALQLKPDYKMAKIALDEAPKRSANGNPEEHPVQRTNDSE